MPAVKAKENGFNEDQLDLNRFIYIKGARSNNLKNISLQLPKNQLIAVTGLSGSGKSSLIMDTLYSEGQRRYVESLSSYARQFLNRMKKPEVDYIKGICPAIAIEQRVSSGNTRSTVGSLTELNDFLRLFFARVGKTISPISGKIVKKHQVSDVVDYVFKLPEGTKLVVYSPAHKKSYDRTMKKELDVLMQKGYSRIRWEGAVHQIEDVLESKSPFLKKNLSEVEEGEWDILIDRFAIKTNDEELQKRAADSIQTAFYESDGHCVISIVDGKEKTFNNRFELDGIEFPEPTPQLFNYNNPYGACRRCEGFGRVIGIDENKVIPDPSKSIYEGAVAAWNGEKLKLWKERFVQAVAHMDFPVHRPYRELSDEQKELLWRGNNAVEGIDLFFEELESKSYKIQNRVMLARYRGRTHCPECKGSRLRKEASYVKIHGTALPDIAFKSISELTAYFDQLKLDKVEMQIAKRILLEIKNRLHIMMDVGLGYLSLDRISNTLSGGETQRIHLTRTLSSNLTASMYILDEPSIGLHPRDTRQLVDVLLSLRDLGNTVIVVEHEEEVMNAADYIIDIGPMAGRFGGEIVFDGPYQQFLKKARNSLTHQYLTGKKTIEVPTTRRKIINKLEIKGARQHNLKDIDVTIPFHAMTCVTGISGSGKTTLVKHILYPGLRKMLGEPYSQAPGNHTAIEGDYKIIDQLEMIGQQPLGRSSRSNPVTYVKAYDAIRNLMANQQVSKIRGYKPKHFSFNVEGGRCENCKGDGEIVVEMQFLADVKLTCDECKGKRFKAEVLEVNYNEKNIYDVLDMSIDDAIDFFADVKEIVKKIQPLQDVGLGYIKLGQSSSTLSGGEAQRVKLASFLGREREGKHILFIFDEPTTGLHFHDIQKLLTALNALVEQGHSVIVIEHNMDVIKCADWVVDLGPEGGKDGGHLVIQGTPEQVAEFEGSYTGQFLKSKL